MYAAAKSCTNQSNGKKDLRISLTGPSREERKRGKDILKNHLPIEWTEKGISMEKKITYTIAHIGISHENETAAADTLAQLMYFFGVEPQKEDAGKVFAGELFEVMKHDRLGARGHIALRTEDVEAAMADLAQRGITFREETFRRDETGKIVFAYLTQEIAGFAFHLTV